VAARKAPPVAAHDAIVHGDEIALDAIVGEDAIVVR